MACATRVLRILKTSQWMLVYRALPALMDALLDTIGLGPVLNRLGQILGGEEEEDGGRGRVFDDEAAKIAEIEAKEKEFHGFVRENIVCLLIFISLYLFSYWLISRYKGRTDADSLYSGEEDYVVYRISVWMCTVGLAVSLGSIALLPFSILGAELLQRYPSNYYLQWLSWSLIHSLWNYVFILSNLSLFVLLPFAYFFIESQGFNKLKTGVVHRAYETAAVCALLVLVLLCLSDLVFTLLGEDSTPFSFSFGLSSLNVPLLYSIVSLLGVLLLLVSTPIGFTRVFGVISELAQARPSPPLEEDISIDRLESCWAAAQQRMTKRSAVSIMTEYCNGRSRYGSSGGVLYNRRVSMSKLLPYTSNGVVTRSRAKRDLGSGDSFLSSNVSSWSTTFYSDRSDDSIFGASSSTSSSAMMAQNIPSPSTPISIRSTLFRQKSLRWYEQLLRTIKYTAGIVILLSLTALSVLLVCINTLKLCLGYRGLPVYAQYIEVSSRHSFGLVGVAFEIVVILYVMACSVVGVYALPLLRGIRPRRGQTSMTSVIINCSAIVILSSALPVLASTLGLTTFDLRGAYSSLKWLSNFRLVFSYNVIFALVTMALLVNRATSPVRQHFIKSIRDLHPSWRSANLGELPYNDEKTE